MAVCPNCDGKGNKLEELKFGLRNISCPTCMGTGKVDPPWDKKKICSACNGLGYMYADPKGYKKGFISSKTGCKKCAGRGMV
jgi:DnaJ-class molecular chaperone